MASSIPFLSNEECDKLLDWNQLIDRLRTAVTAFSNGLVCQPIRATLEFPRGFCGLMPCFSPTANVISCKIVLVLPDNAKRNKSSHIVNVALFDALDGSLKLLMDGEAITQKRTAAASALSALTLASPSPKSLTILGSGHQAESHFDVLTHLYPSIDKVHVWNHRRQSALAFVSNKEKKGVTLKVHDSVEEASADADLICTTTFASDPVLLRSHVKKKKVHIMAVGAARPTMSELDPDLMNEAEVFVDSRAGATTESGDIMKSQCRIAGEIGEVLDGRVKPTNDLTLYKSLGMAVQDLAAASLILETLDLNRTGSRKVLRLKSDDDGDNDTCLEVKVGPIVESEVSSPNISLKVKVFQLISAHKDLDFTICELRTSLTHVVLAYDGVDGDLLGVLEGSCFHSCSNKVQFHQLLQLKESAKK